MNLQKTRRFLRENFIFYLAGIAVVLGIKYYYSHAECDSLLWILAPTTRWVELLSGIPFTYVSGTGYVNHSLRLLIAPSCSGVRFMIITIAMLVFSFVHIVASPKDAALPRKAAGSVLRVGKGTGWIVVCVVFSWLFTILVNGLRIIVAIYLPLYLDRAGLIRGMLTSDRLHTMIGVVVYFTALLMLYHLVNYVVQRKINLTGYFQKSKADRIIDNSAAPREQFLKTLIGKCMPPVFWYFLMTVGLPFINRAYLKEGTKFKEFVILIICCTVLILLPYCMILTYQSKKK